MRLFQLALLAITVMATSGCITSGGNKFNDVLPATQLNAKAITVIALDHKPSTIDKELWEKSMVSFGIRDSVNEKISDCTEAKIFSPVKMKAILSHDQQAQLISLEKFIEGVQASPAATKRIATVIETNLNKLVALKLDYVVVCWISKFSVIGTTKTFAGPASQQSRDCKIWAEVAIYDIKNKTLLRNQGRVNYKVNSMGLVITPSKVITDFDLNIASKASQEAITQATEKLLGVK